MYSYPLIHDSLAAFSAFMAVVHLAMWVFARHERVQLWVAVSFLGWVGVGYGLARSSIFGDPGHLDPALWWLVGPAVIPVWIGYAMTAWSIGKRPLNVWRWGFIAVAVAVALWRVADVYFLIESWNQQGRTVTWEVAFNTFEAASTGPFWVITLAVSVVWFLEAFRALRKQPLAWLLLAAVIPTTAFIIWDLLLTVGVLKDLPAMIGPAGFVFGAFASILVATRYVQAVRIARNTGGYRLIKPLAAGGMGSLHLAVRTGPAGFERYVALKRMLRTGKKGRREWVERFLSEARVAAQLRHPNIIAVHDLGHLPDGWYIAMEYLSGFTLSELRKLARDMRVQIPVSLVVNVGESVCRALAYAHERGVVHRDISPQNIMITFDGYVKVIDFGIAKAAATIDDETADPPASPLATPDLTKTGRVVGKAPYLPPERLRGQPATEHTDLYALAVVIYELLCGSRPFTGDTARARLQAMLNEDFVPPSAVRPDTPAGLSHLFTRSLRRNVDERYPDAKSLGEAFHAIAAQLPSQDPSRWLRDSFPQHFAAEQELLGGLPLAARASSVVSEDQPTLQQEAEEEAATTPVVEEAVTHVADPPEPDQPKPK